MPKVAHMLMGWNAQCKRHKTQVPKQVCNAQASLQYCFMLLVSREQSKPGHILLEAFMVRGL